MLQTSLLLMKSLNKTETPIFLSVVCSLFPKAMFLTFISRPTRRLLKWKGRVYELLAILKGDRDANKMPIRGDKIKECKVILWSNLHDFKIICRKWVQVSFHLLVGQTLYGFFMYI